MELTIEDSIEFRMLVGYDFGKKFSGVNSGIIG